MPVIIAAHPKSRYNINDSPFGDRIIKLGQTPELVKGSSLVLGHASCALNFAMLWTKPISIITSKDLNASYLSAWIQARAKITKSTIYNIDDRSWVFLSNKIFSVNSEVYKKYIRNYIKVEESFEEPLWKIFIHGIKFI